jgi:hypothetical protein
LLVYLKMPETHGRNVRLKLQQAIE